MYDEIIFGQSLEKLLKQIIQYFFVSGELVGTL